MFVGALLFLAFVVLVIVGIVSVLATLVSSTGLRGVLATLAVPLLLIGGVVIVIRSFARTWWPVRSLIRAAGRLADGDYTVRVRTRGSAAIRPVLASFNDMARRLEDADEQRRRLLADLGHELRTPLTVVRGEIEAMLDGVHRPDPEHLELLIGEVEVMERLLEDLRTLSLIDAGALALRPELIDVDQLVEDVVDGHRRRAAKAGVAVTVDAEDVELVGDAVRLREVISNLVVNSLRAMPGGGELRVSTRRNGGGAVVEVADTGVGIPPDELAHVFDRFHKGSTSSGSGLGLTISRDLVAAHGGSIALESEVGSGTTVRVELPGAQPPSKLGLA